MTTELNEDGTPKNPPADTSKPKTDEEKDAELVAKLVEERVAAELAEIKDKLNKAYKSRDEALTKAAELELKEKDALKAKLEADGKYKELYELQLQEKEEKLAQERARVEALEKRNTELSRDVTVRDALKGLNWRNAAASEMAYREIVGQLKQNEQGTWTHRSGVTIAEFVQEFAKSEDNSFLFKAKQSSGGGSSAPEGTAAPNAGGSLFKMKQADVLKMAKEGKLPQRK